jgi:predicted nucleic acid-binding protein
MIDILVDTDILIDTFHQRENAIAFLKQYEQTATLGISTITQIEILVGCRNKTEQRKTEKFLRRFEMASLTETIANQAVSLIQQYRLSHGLLLPDSLIAATALVLNIPLASKNQKHFRYITGLQVIPYP